MERTPLFAEHQRRNAHIAPFGSWEMPIQYESIIAEHRQCRSSAALFDTCHMGELIFRGDPAQHGMDQIFSFPVSSIPVGRSRYGFLLNHDGGILDDLIVYRLADDELMIVTNSETRIKDLTVIGQRLHGGQLDDTGYETGKLDLQGPLSREILASVLGETVRTIPFFAFRQLEVPGLGQVLLSRTGYTGELGYELYLQRDVVLELWNRLLGDGRVAPAGLGARDLLRLEMGYSLYGSDLDESVTPVEAGLEMFVDYNREFVGRDRLLQQRQQGPERTKIAFRLDSRRSPRHGQQIMQEGRVVGTVTSGAFSPMLVCGIGIGLASPDSNHLQSRLSICSGSTRLDGQVTTLPFYQGGTLRT